MEPLTDPYRAVARRAAYLDGLRALACLDVVLFHASAIFLPSMPLGLVINGASPVAIFFLISGFVLTGSFEASAAPAALVAVRRIIRLALPALLSAILAALILCAGDASARAALLATGAIGLNQLTFGLAALPVHGASLNPPLWTISIEIWGSLLVLLLVRLRRRSLVSYRAMLAGLAVLLGFNELSLFIVGHLLARLAARRGLGAGGAAVPAGLVLAGLALCATANDRRLAFPALPYGLLPLPTYCPLLVEIGAVLLFIGILRWPGLRVLLAIRPARWLGRLSFSIYLLHFPIMAAMAERVFPGPRAGGLAGLAICAALTLLAAILFERYCDRPVIAAARLPAGP